MRLDLCTWLEVEAYLENSRGIILPTGSTEQHGPIGLIGTDRLCAQTIADKVGEEVGALVCTALGYTPAPFNMSFPGTLSLSVETYTKTVEELVKGLTHHGFDKIYILNGHGANLEPIGSVVSKIATTKIRLKSWWDFEEVNKIRSGLYGEWEGMHATPSEIAITQAAHRHIEHPHLDAPEKLSADFIKAHAGDKHGPPDEHRARFPDGRVGSHSSLAKPEHGEKLIEAATAAISKDYLDFIA